MIGTVSNVLGHFKAIVTNKEIETRKAFIEWSEALFSTASFVSESTGFGGLAGRFSCLTALLSKGRKAFELPKTVQKFESFKASLNRYFKDTSKSFFDSLEKTRALAINTFKFASAFTGASQLLIKEKIISFGSMLDSVICEPGIYLRNIFGNRFGKKFWDTFEKVSGIGKVFTAAYLSLSLVDDVRLMQNNPQRGLLKVATTTSFISLCLFAKVMRNGMAPVLALAASTSVLYQMRTSNS